MGGNKFEKAIFNGKKDKNFSEAFDVVVKEAGQEALEEGIPQAYLESQLYQLNPDRDVVGNVVRLILCLVQYLVAVRLAEFMAVQQQVIFLSNAHNSV